MLFDYIAKEVERLGAAPIATSSKHRSCFLRVMANSGPSRSRSSAIKTASPCHPERKRISGFTVPGDLRTAWETATIWSQRDLPPETASPFVWRTYLDTLLRWEYLVRAGAPTDAIQRRAEALERELRKDIFDSDPPCLGNSLAVPLAFGLTIQPVNSAPSTASGGRSKTINPGDIWDGLVNTARVKGGERAVALCDWPRSTRCSRRSRNR